MKENLPSFQKWLKSPSQGIKLHHSLEIRRHRKSEGYGVYTKADIEEDTIIMQVPKSTLLSPRTSAISNILESADFEPMTACCLAYLYERSKGRESPWHEYVQICPETVPISKLWSKEDQSILKGTEVAMVGGTSLRDFKETFQSDVKPFLKRHRDELGSFAALSFDEFTQGMSIVGSRAFEVDAYHGLAMCPFADMLDHETDEHVHFQTTFDVCPECGDEGGCEHDPDESDDEEDDEENDEEESTAEETARHNPVVPLQATFDHDAACLDQNCSHDRHSNSSDENEEDTCDFTVVRAIKAGSQVYNTYGDLGNDVLLARYGFALPNNPYDNTSLGPEVLKLRPQYLEWWSLNGNNLMQALHPLTLTGSTTNQDFETSKSSQKSSGDSMDDSMSHSDTDSFMEITEDTLQDEDDDEDEDLADSCSIDYEGRPSSHCLIYLFLTTMPLKTLESKSGPEVKAYIQVLVGTWRYIQPGRGPLPPYLFHDAVRTCLSIINTLYELIAHRRKRYSLAFDDIDQKRVDQKYVYAKIVRECEQQILARGESYLTLLQSAGRWILERDA